MHTCTRMNSGRLHSTLCGGEDELCRDEHPGWIGRFVDANEESGGSPAILWQTCWQSVSGPAFQSVLGRWRIDMRMTS